MTPEAALRPAASIETGVGRGSNVHQCRGRAQRSRSAHHGAEAPAEMAASASWYWRTAKRSMGSGFCRPAGATSPASLTAPLRASVGSCPTPPWDTATTGGRCRTCRPASTPAPFWRSAPSASTSTSIRPRAWSLSSRARGVGIMTAMPPPRPSRCSELRCSPSDRTRRPRARRATFWTAESACPHVR
jgi:hypothetical protein